MADLIDYLFQFPNQGAAEADLLVNPFFNNSGAPLGMLVFPNLLQNSSVAMQGFWPLVVKPAPVDSALMAHQNIILINNRTAFINGLPSLLFTKIPTAALGLVFNIYGNYANGLSGPGTPLNPPVLANDANTILLTDPDGNLLLAG